MPKVSSEHLESRRRKILSAALRCFGRKGFHQTTMRDICRQARLSSGALYLYFKSKEDLIRAVAEEARRAGAARFGCEGAGQDPVTALVHSLRRFLDCLADPKSLSSIRIDVRLCAEALQEKKVRSAVLQNFRSFFDQFEPLVRRGQKQGRINETLEPEAVARVAVALFQGLEFQKALDPQVDVQACARVAAALLDGGFAASAASEPAS